MDKLLKVAIFDLTGCEGCQFHLLSLNEYLLDFFQEFDIVNWRLMSQQDKQKADFDIAVIEGAATTDKHVKLLKEIRTTSSLVIAIGACATTGNFFAQLTPKQRQKLAPQIYDKNYQLKAKFLEPVDKFIKVDHKIQGCPPDIKAFRKLLAELKQNKDKSKVKAVTLPDYTAKIEGHGSLNINFSQKKTEFIVEESERLVEGLVQNKNYAQVPAITSRICGICPIAHNMASWAAIENALSVVPSPETVVLRQILTCGQMIKSHCLHLFFLVLPDYAGVKGGVELAKKYPAEFHLMLNIKRVADKALQIVGGSDAFPTNTALGGFIKAPEIEQLLSLSEEIEAVLDESQDLIKLFASLEYPIITVHTKLATTTPQGEQYPYYPGTYNQAVKEIVRTSSTAKLAVLPNGVVIKSGALARLSAYHQRLNPYAQKYWQSSKLVFTNPYHNNLAQAIEILHFLEEIIRLTLSLKNKNLSQSQAIKPKALDQTVEGKSSIEAPRGILLHQVKINPNYNIQFYNIIPPTQINLASLEKETQVLIEKTKSTQKNKIKREVEALIRAFDPCITCAVH